MKRIYSFIVIILAAVTPIGAQPAGQVNLSSEDSVKNIILNLPEVKAKDHVYDSITGV